MFEPPALRAVGGSNTPNNSNDPFPPISLFRGAVSDGVLSLGWHGPHAATLQRYSGPGSPTGLRRLSYACSLVLIIHCGRPQRSVCRVGSWHDKFELRVHRVVGLPHGATVEETGWATGPDDPTVLRPVHGWSDQDEVRAPEGTAFTPWARMPRLTGEGAGIYAALVVLGEADDVAEVVNSTDDSVTIRWPGGSTRIDFDPIAVTRTS